MPSGAEKSAAATALMLSITVHTCRTYHVEGIAFVHTRSMLPIHVAT